tara:strand:- start:6216 stop:6827 length:612 start_codon:yes stop_codon:yes gene_type:complete
MGGFCSGNPRDQRTDNRTSRQRAADNVYATQLARATKDDPNRNVTGFADPLKVISGSSLPDAGFDRKLRDAYNERQRANVAARNMRPDGTQKDDDRPKKEETPAAVAPVDEEEETTTTPPATPATPAAPTYTPTNYTNPSNTAAAQSVLADQDRGPKGGTIETSAQGISKDDTSGLRPKRKLKPKGLLTAETPARNQSLLAAA